MKKSEEKNQPRSLELDKGFTMIELIIVIAIMGILSAVLIPSFSNMTIKTRLKADIATLYHIQNQIDIYVAEHGGLYPNTTTGKGAETIEATTVDKDLNEYTQEYRSDILPSGVGSALVAEGYLNQRDILTVLADANKVKRKIGDIKLQTKGALIAYDSDDKISHLLLEIPTSDMKLINIAETLSGEEEEWWSKGKAGTLEAQ